MHTSIDSNGIAHVIFDQEGSKVNVLSVPIFEQLDKILDELKNNKQIKALIFSSAKEGIFIAGADLKSFKGVFDDHSLAKNVIQKGHDSLDKVSHLPFPTIALIDGACLGGGMEFALACNYRVVTTDPKTQLGLPEVSLGIFPGWGGTQRLPKLVGFRDGLQMILTGKPVNGFKAWKMKLADALVSPEFKKEKTEEFVKEILTKEGRKKILSRRSRKGITNLLLEKNPLGRSLVTYLSKKKILKETKGHYPAPLLALKVIDKTYTDSLEKGLKKERQYFLDNLETSFKVAPNLIKIFFNNEALKGNPGVPTGAVAKKITSAGVLGAGTMGSGIAWLFSNADIPVRMKDINWEAVAKGYAAASSIYKTLIRIKKLKPTEANMKFLRIAGTTDYSGFRNVDIVVEAATENLELKEKIFAELEKEIKPDCLIATNTSSLSVTILAKGLKHPERLVGMHFFNPPNRMPLVEVVQGEKTSADAVATAVELCKRLKKTPIVVKDCPGFLVNRILVLGMGEAIKMMEEGVPMEKIEHAILDFGMPMGPFTLSDEVGNDVGYKVGKIFEEAYGSRMTSSKLLEKMNEKKLLGKKTGKGFYIYEKNSKKPNTDLQPNLKKELTEQEIIDRFTLCMLNEASRCLEEKVVSSPQNLDMAMILGTGFPPFRGGLLNYADQIGIGQIVSKLKELEKTQGPRFTPSNLLLQMEKENKKFY